MRPGRLLLGALAALALALPAAAAPPVWRIKQGQAEIVLFGSVHLLSATEGWRSPELMADLARADEIWFEVPFDAAGRAGAAKAAAARGFLPKGRTLSSLLDAPTQARLARATAELGLPPQSLERLQPWMAEVAIGLAYVSREGAREALGVESQVQALAPPSAEHRAFETPAQQIGFFAGTPISEQVASLAESLRQIEEEPDSFAKLQAAWLAGDLGAIETEALAPLKAAAPGMYERLVTRRNRAWAEAIQQMLKSGRRAFIVVGVGHLIGPEGTPNLLRRRGVKVEGP